MNRVRGPRPAILLEGLDGNPRGVLAEAVQRPLATFGLGPDHSVVEIADDTAEVQYAIGRNPTPAGFRSTPNIGGAPVRISEDRVEKSLSGTGAMASSIGCPASRTPRVRATLK